MQRLYNSLKGHGKTYRPESTKQLDQYDLRLNPIADIKEFQTYPPGLDIFWDEDQVIVDHRVHSAHIQKSGSELTITFKDSEGSILPEYRVKIHNYNGDIKDIDIYQFNRSGDLTELKKSRMFLYLDPSENTGDKQLNQKSLLNPFEKANRVQNQLDPISIESDQIQNPTPKSTL